MLPVCILVIPRRPDLATNGPKPSVALLSGQAELVRGLFGPERVALYDAAQFSTDVTALPLTEPMPVVWPWLPGFAEALVAAKDRFPVQGLLLADVSRLSLDEPLLRQFFDTIAEDPQRPLLSVRTCRDHPCQLLRFLRANDCLTLVRPPSLHDAQRQEGMILAESEQTWPERARWTWERSAGGGHVLRREPERACCITCEALDVAGLLAQSLRGDMGPGCGPLPLGDLPESVRTLFITENTEACGDFHRAEALEDAPGLWRKLNNGYIRNEQTGKLVTGRQDFPFVAEPDPLLAYVPAGMANAGLPGIEACRPWTLPVGLPESAPGDALGQLALWAYLEARRTRA